MPTLNCVSYSLLIWVDRLVCLAEDGVIQEQNTMNCLSIKLNISNFIVHLDNRYIISYPSSTLPILILRETNFKSKLYLPKHQLTRILIHCNHCRTYTALQSTGLFHIINSCKRISNTNKFWIKVCSEYFAA